MADVSGSPPSPRTPLFWNGVAWLRALVDAAGRLIVRGEDQLFSFDAVVARVTVGAISGANGFLDSLSVPAGCIWEITTVVAYNTTSPTTRMDILNRHDASDVLLKREFAAFAANHPSVWSGRTFLDVDDVIRVAFLGGLVGDTCRVDITGYQMTLET